MPKSLALLPMPRKIIPRAGRFVLPAVFSLDSGRATDAFIQFLPDPSLFPRLSRGIRDQSYRLTISPDGIVIRFTGEPGRFYAMQTLRQVIRISPATDGCTVLPCLTIDDYPDFERRGFYHDTARGKVPKLKTLLQLIDDLAHLKYNELQLYIENNFQFRKHPDMYDDTTPFTPRELRQLDAACRERHIDFVPSLTSLGHFEKILRRPKYRALAEAEPKDLVGTDVPARLAVQTPWSLCVTDPRSKILLKEMYDDFLPNFSSPYFNICCDESFDLGKGRSAKHAKKIGAGRLYVDWINFCNSLARKHGKKIQFWGDILINHPDHVTQLPKDATILEWGYEADHPFDKNCATFASHARKRSNLSLYVCPGTSSWLTFSSRSKNAIANIHNAARAGLKHGAKGLLITDWGDRGHQQFLAVSLNPLAYGAAVGWNCRATPRPDTAALRPLLRAISTHVFQDSGGNIAQLAYDLGLTYERVKARRANASVDWFLFREPWEGGEFLDKTTAAALRATARHAFNLSRRIPTLDRSDGDLLHRELVHTCLVIVYTCWRTFLRKDWQKASPMARPQMLAKIRSLDHQASVLEKDFATLWLQRNKRSRLADVVREFRKHRSEYKRLLRFI